MEFVVKNQKQITDLIWGVLLTIAGIGVFIRVSYVMPQIVKTSSFASDSSWFIRFSFYLIGIILIGGGIKKIFLNAKYFVK